MRVEKIARKNEQQEAVVKRDWVGHFGRVSNTGPFSFLFFSSIVSIDFGVFDFFYAHAYLPAHTHPHTHPKHTHTHTHTHDEGFSSWRLYDQVVPSRALLWHYIQVEGVSFRSEIHSKSHIMS